MCIRNLILISSYSTFSLTRWVTWSEPWGDLVSGCCSEVWQRTSPASKLRSCQDQFTACYLVSIMWSMNVIPTIQIADRLSNAIDNCSLSINLLPLHSTPWVSAAPQNNISRRSPPGTPPLLPSSTLAIPSTQSNIPPPDLSNQPLNTLQMP